MFLEKFVSISSGAVLCLLPVLVNVTYLDLQYRCSFQTGFSLPPPIPFTKKFPQQQRVVILKWNDFCLTQSTRVSQDKQARFSDAHTIYNYLPTYEEMKQK